MKYLDGFRAPDTARQLALELQALGTALGSRKVQLMEVCGSHTMSIARYAIRDLLPENVRMVSGPGCPVCVTAPGYIDAAIALGEQGVHLATFGDMMRVPGSRGNLAQARAEGASVKVCYSPAQVIEWAQAEPSQEWVFLAIGFETTTAPIAAMAQSIRKLGLKNLTLLTALKRIPPALDALVADPEVALHGLLCPAHVSAIIGAETYQVYADTHRIPCVVAGFEPLDIIFGIKGLLEQLLRNKATVDNQYSRVVRPGGNTVARQLIDAVFEPADVSWRGLGTIPGSGLRLKNPDLDAAVRYAIEPSEGRVNPGCKCGDVLKGILEPKQCRLFDKGCHPDRPLGPCMVSSEGSCAAAWKYERRP